MLTELMSANLPILTIEEAVLQGGFGSAVLEFAEENGFHNAYIERIGIPDEFIEHGSVGKLLNDIDLTADHVVERLSKMTYKVTKKAY